jgi:hypothetical protein
LDLLSYLILVLRENGKTATLTEMFRSCSRYNFINAHIYASMHTHVHKHVVTSDNRMVSRCYRGKTRCTEFTRYPTVVKMLKQQLSAPENYPPATSVCVYVPSSVYSKVWKMWIILSCDCPCGDSIKIRVAFRTTVQDRKE